MTRAQSIALFFAGIFIGMLIDSAIQPPIPKPAPVHGDRSACRPGAC